MVSVDKPEDNKRFAEEFGVTFPILSDPDKSVGTAYGVLMPQGFAKRWNFFIDKEGVITRIDEKVRAAKAGEDAVSALKELGILGN